MAPQFEVVRCSGCSMSRVKQVTKLRKFSCVICGEKQSIKAVLYVGASRDCRERVQQLNALLATRSTDRLSLEDDQPLMTASENEHRFPPSEKTYDPKWDKFLDKNELLADPPNTTLPSDSIDVEDVMVLSRKGRARQDFVSGSSSLSTPPPAKMRTIASKTPKPTELRNREGTLDQFPSQCEVQRWQTGRTSVTPSLHGDRRTSSVGKHQSQVVAVMPSSDTKPMLQHPSSTKRVPIGLNLFHSPIEQSKETGVEARTSVGSGSGLQATPSTTMRPNMNESNGSCSKRDTLFVPGMSDNTCALTVSKNVTGSSTGVISTFKSDFSHTPSGYSNPYSLTLKNMDNSTCEKSLTTFGTPYEYRVRSVPPPTMTNATFEMKDRPNNTNTCSDLDDMLAVDW